MVVDEGREQYRRRYLEVAKFAKMIVEVAGAVETIVARPNPGSDKIYGQSNFLAPDGTRYQMLITIFAIGTRRKNTV